MEEITGLVAENDAAHLRLEAATVDTAEVGGLAVACGVARSRIQSEINHCADSIRRPTEYSVPNIGFGDARLVAVEINGRGSEYGAASVSLEGSTMGTAELSDRGSAYAAVSVICGGATVPTATSHATENKIEKTVLADVTVETRNSVGRGIDNVAENVSLRDAIFVELRMKHAL